MICGNIWGKLAGKTHENPGKAVASAFVAKAWIITKKSSSDEARIRDPQTSYENRDPKTITVNQGPDIRYLKQVSRFDYPKRGPMNSPTPRGPIRVSRDTAHEKALAPFVKSTATRKAMLPTFQNPFFLYEW